MMQKQYRRLGPVPTSSLCSQPSAIREGGSRTQPTGLVRETSALQPLISRVAMSTLVVAAVLTLIAQPTWAADETSAIEKRLADSARYLSSDELEGRGTETKGLELAAQHIAEAFRQAGLRTDLFDGRPFQEFQLTTSAKVGKNNRVSLVGPAAPDGGEPQRIELKLDEDFMPLPMSGSGSFDLPLVFVGYGITAKDVGYDDYEGVDVTGKAVVILRHEPQQADPHSVFDGTKNSAHAPFTRKVSNAFEHGAAAVVFCTDEFEIQKRVTQAYDKWRQALDRLAEAHAELEQTKAETIEEIEVQRGRFDELIRQVEKWSDRIQAENDPVLAFSRGGPGGEGRDFPVIHCRRAVLDGAVQTALGTDLATLEEQIDHGFAPKSGPLVGWRLTGEVQIERHRAEVDNVVGVLEAEGPLAEETLVIGAHYDHLGFGEPGSLAHGNKAIHNGADDNASGVAVLIEIARQLAARGERLPRRVVFVAFAGEERGLLGSGYYVRNPVAPIEQTIAMINLDMVGRLSGDKLIVSGSGTAPSFDGLLDRLAEEQGFNLTKKPSGFGPSDHSSFYSKKIPVMHFMTGTHKDYHRPSDDFEKLNIPGMRRIGAMIVDVAEVLAGAEQRPVYIAVARPKATSGGGDRPYFGSIPDFAGEGPGYAISGVTEGSPAQKAGLAGDDVIIQFGDSKIGGLEDFDSALRKYEGGDRVPVTVRRDGKQQTFQVTLDPPAP